jgi:hypothetical protein
MANDSKQTPFLTVPSSFFSTDAAKQHDAARHDTAAAHWRTAASEQPCLQNAPPPEAPAAPFTDPLESEEGFVFFTCGHHFVRSAFERGVERLVSHLLTAATPTPLTAGVVDGMYRMARFNLPCPHCFLSKIE